MRRYSLTKYPVEGAMSWSKNSLILRHIGKKKKQFVPTTSSCVIGLMWGPYHVIWGASFGMPLTSRLAVDLESEERIAMEEDEVKKQIYVSITEGTAKDHQA